MEDVRSDIQNLRMCLDDLSQAIQIIHQKDEPRHTKPAEHTSCPVCGSLWRFQQKQR